MTAAAAGATTRLYRYPNHPARDVEILIDDARDARLTEFGKATLRDRYLLPGESYQDLFARVACANSDEVVRGDLESGHAQRAYDAISLLWFMPATPVLTNSGTGRGLPISCFLNRVGDSMDSISETVFENIWLAAKGGGIGTSWSDVRSIGEDIAGSITGQTSGIVPFIKWQDAQTEAISQGSLRRGSAAVYVDISHPEIEDFIEIRRHQGGDPRRKAHNIHHGVTIPDAFMDKVFNDDPAARVWSLVSPHSGGVIEQVDARALYIKLITARLETGEPYIVFSDRVAELQPEIQKALGLKVVQSNLCSEITLPTGEDHRGVWRTAVCCLSSLNMDTADEWKGNDAFIADFFHFLDNVLQNFIDRTEGMKGFDRARYSAMRERSVGGGIMGFHSSLQARGLPYESVQAQAISEDLWSWLKPVSERINEEMADVRGECPDSADARLIDPTIRPKRLSNMWAIAPTASISIIAGGASACYEPIPANSYTQKTLSGSFNVRNPHLDVQLRRRYNQLRESLDAANKTVAFILKELPMFRGILDQTEDEWLEDQWQSITVNDGSVRHLAYLCDLEKAVFRTAFEIDQRWVIKQAAAIAPHICQAISINVFLPSTVHKKDLNDLHRLAWESGLKSLYYLRSRSASKAMAVSHVAGDLPNAEIDQRCALGGESGPMYIDEPECAACQ